MKRFKRAAAMLLAAVLSIGALTGCGEEPVQQTILVPETLSVCLGSSPVTLDPAYATESRDLTVISNLYDNLMTLSSDEDGNTIVVPAMVRSYETEKNIDGSVTYTFRLRSAKWSDGTAVTADDFVYAWRRLADPAVDSPSSRLLSIIKGYDQVQTTGDITALQVSAKNSSTFIVTITGTCEWFLTDVCTSPAAVPLRKAVVDSLTAALIAPSGESTSAVAPAPAPDAWAADPTKLVTNGPYCVGKSNAASMTLVQNERYSSNADGPRTIHILYAATLEDGWTMYQSNKVDLLAELPEQQLKALAEDPQWTPLAKPATCVLLFNTTHEVLGDPLVREALQTVIDRTAISTASGAACTPANGLVSLSVPDPDDVNFRSHGGDLVNCDASILSANRAEILQRLEEAGFDADTPFPAMELLYPDLPGYAETARQLASFWAAAFNMEVTLTPMESTALDAALQSGTYVMALTELTTPFNDAQGFLQRWATNHQDNLVHYSNTAFDTLLAVIRSASDDYARRGCLHDAESLLLETSPLTPLYFPGTAYALREGLTGHVRDARGTFRLDGIQQIILPQEPDQETVS